MSETPRLGLALLDAAQSQKHITVNEALARLDAVAAGRLEATGLVVPPPTPGEGTLWGVGLGAGGDWAGQDGMVALWLSGGWSFLVPWEGWELWDASTGLRLRRGPTGWLTLGGVTSPGGAETVTRIVETDHTPSAGSTSTTSPIIPDKAVVTGVSARVLLTLGGTSAWRLGVAADGGRYGSGFGSNAGSVAVGVTGSPLAYYGGTALLLTAEGGAFDGTGSLRIAVHLTEIAPPA